jgi:hypothetical protein
MTFDDLTVLIRLHPPRETLAFDVTILISLSHKKKNRPSPVVRLKGQVIAANALVDHFTRRIRFSEYFVYF